MDYFQLPQYTYLIANREDANWFSIKANMAQIKFEVKHEDYFYRFELFGQVDKLVKFKKDWDDYKALKDPISVCDYLIAVNQVNNPPKSFEVITGIPWGLRSNNFGGDSYKLKIASERQGHYELNQVKIK